MDDKIAIREMQNKLYELNERIKELQQKITVQKEQTLQYNNHINEISDQVKYYKKQINSKSDILEESDIIENKDDDDEDDKTLVYKSLKQRLKEIYQKLSIIGTFPNKKPIEKGETISFQCICVILLEKNPLDEKNEEINVKFQTLKIYHDTIIRNILNSCINLWNLEQNDNNKTYKLYFIEVNDKITEMNENDNVVYLLKQKKELKNARFILCLNDIKNPLESLKIVENNENDNIIIKSSSDAFERFTQNIVGMTTYIKKRYVELKEEEENIKGIFEEDEKILFLKKLRGYGILSLNMILFFLFFIFSILSLCSMKNPNQTYHEVDELKNRFNSHFQNALLNKTFIQNSDEVRHSILSIFKDFYYNNDRLIQLPLVVISKVRISFYESNKQNCQKDYNNFYMRNYHSNPECYKLYYDYDEDNYKGYYSPYIINLGYNDNESICINPDDFFIYTNLTSNSNFIQNCSLLYHYFYYFFQGWYSTPVEVDDIFIKGDLGNYGKHSVNIFFSINYINEKVLDEALKLLTHNKTLNNTSYEDKEYDYFSGKFQQACVVVLTVYNVFTKHYYYISFLYEFSTMTGNALPKIDIIPFIPDLSKTSGGKNIKVLDIFRLIIILLISLSTIYQFYLNFTTKTKRNISNKGKHIKQHSFLSAFFTMEVIIDIVNLIIFFILFVRKKKSLYQNMIKNENISIDNKFFQLETKEYQQIVHDYQFVIQLESLLIVLLLFRILIFLNQTPRVKRYFNYLRLSLYRVYPYFILYFFFCIMFAIFAQQIWGNYDKNYQIYNRSLLSVIEFSIFHVQKIIYNNKNNNIYAAIFTFIFYVILIYFMINTFFGIYLECYRLTTLKHGIGYDSRIIKKIKDYEKKSNHNISTDTQNSDIQKLKV